MVWNRIVVSLISGLILVFLNIIGLRNGLYGERGENKWFGKIMHFSGGLFAALFWSSFFSDWLLVVTLTFLVGVFWEIGEYFYGIYKLKKSKTSKYLIHTKDTIEDLIFDITGASVLVVFLKLFL